MLAVFQDRTDDAWVNDRQRLRVEGSAVIGPDRSLERNREDHLCGGLPREKRKQAGRDEDQQRDDQSKQETIPAVLLCWRISRAGENALHGE